MHAASSLIQHCAEVVVSTINIVIKKEKNKTLVTDDKSV